MKNECVEELKKTIEDSVSSFCAWKGDLVCGRLDATTAEKVIEDWASRHVILREKDIELDMLDSDPINENIKKRVIIMKELKKNEFKRLKR